MNKIISIAKNYFLGILKVLQMLVLNLKLNMKLILILLFAGVVLFLMNQFWFIVLAQENDFQLI
jgi:hypothetical protein